MERRGRQAGQEVTPHKPRKTQEGFAKELKEFRVGTKASVNGPKKQEANLADPSDMGPSVLASEWLLLLAVRAQLCLAHLLGSQQA